MAMCYPYPCHPYSPVCPVSYKTSQFSIILSSRIFSILMLHNSQRQITVNGSPVSLVKKNTCSKNLSRNKTLDSHFIMSYAKKSVWNMSF